MSPEYQIRVGGTIGPVVASSLPGFAITALPASTLVSGTVTDTEELRAVLDVLQAHGLAPIDTLISPETAADRPSQ